MIVNIIYTTHAWEMYKYFILKPKRNYRGIVSHFWYFQYHLPNPKDKFSNLSSFLQEVEKPELLNMFVDFGVEID